MTKWEYKTHTYCPYAGECNTLIPVDRRPLREILAALGEEGWEFVMKEKAGQCPGGGAHEELTFKRPLEYGKGLITIACREPAEVPA